MQIGQRILNGYHNAVQNADTTKSQENVAVSKSLVGIQNLNEGTVFRGEILDIVGEKVTIALENEATLMARLEAGVELGVGDRLLFSVKENTSSQILIKPMFDSLYSAQTQVLEKALDAAGLSPTEKNFMVAKELMDAGMPVDKANIVKVLSQSIKYEGTSLQTLTSLNKMNIPVTPENIAQYERYQGMEHQLTGDIARASDSIADFTTAFSRDADGRTLGKVANEIARIFIGDTPGEGMESGGGLDFLEHQPNAMPGSSTSEPMFTTQSSEYDKAALFSNTDGERTVKTQEHIQTQEPSQYANSDKDGWNFPKQVISLTEDLKQAGVRETQIQQILQQSDSEEAVLKNVLSNVDVQNMEDEALKNLLRSEFFKHLLSEVIQKSFALNPKQMKDPKEIDELYESILKNTKSFEETIASNGGDTKEFQQNFQNMRQNMQFIHELNQQMIYAQMPVKLSDKQTNSELYVYADKRKLLQKKDGISVMLHLDMDNLGATDIKVTLTGTKVHARFYLNDTESVDVVAANMNQLEKQLAERGFSLTNEVVKRQPQESINQVIDEIIDENAEKSVKRYTFDART